MTTAQTERIHDTARSIRHDGLRVELGGEAARAMGRNESSGAEGAGILAALVILMMVFRSLLIPLKAAVLNLLSIGAALGAMTLVFQHGMLGAEAGPIEPWLPVVVFAAFLTRFLPGSVLPGTGPGTALCPGGVQCAAGSAGCGRAMARPKRIPRSWSEPCLNSSTSRG
ncbi:MMPL family transporter [Embleya sp. NPDC020630]|uniref:MMPL family transporter n=1 Tax=Embleya sp. NPDC020630 TaxID=3363979 RepID=UPI0037B97E7D